MTKTLGIALLLIGASVAAMASPAGAPEIDAGAASSALALLAGAALVIRGRRKK
ncbi:MAG TPA: hypothetical protein VMU19_07970 [Bryobacteraceae bacterium]|nr:hypothetical protein [Bryobacteraceae bacterium]